MGQAQGFEAGDLVAGLWGSGQPGGLIQSDEFVPEFPFDEGLDQSGAAVTGAAAAFVPTVLSGVLWMGDEALGHG